MLNIILDICHSFTFFFFHRATQHRCNSYGLETLYRSLHIVLQCHLTTEMKHTIEKQGHHNTFIYQFAILTSFRVLIKYEKLITLTKGLFECCI